MQVRNFIHRNTFIATAPLQKTVYRRKFPSLLVALGSHDGQKMFKESLRDGNCQAFFPLAQHFITQSAPHTCGPTTIAMLLNALNIDPQINWKGIWRWYDDWNIKKFNYQDFHDKGMDMLQFHQTMQKNHADSMVFSPQETRNEAVPNVVKKGSIDLFRAAVLASVRRNNTFLAINYNRPSLNQTGSGHFGPIAAYHKQSDRVLFLEVARFKYDSYWCSLEDCYRSLIPIDQETKMSRGFFIHRKSKLPGEAGRAPICSLQNDQEANSVIKEIIKTVDGPIACIKELLNNRDCWPGLLPLLYDYHCSATRKHIQEINQVMKEIFPEKVQPLNQLFQNHLLLADNFCLENSIQIGKLIYLILQLSPRLQRSIPQHEISKLIRKYRLILGFGSQLSTKE